MSYTMHSPSQGYSMPFSDASADVYASRAYGSHLMAQNYSAYLNRDDPYNGHSGLHSSAGHYGPNGPGTSALQSAHSMYGGSGGGGPVSSLSGSGISQQTYPSLPPISHFSHQQDLYSSCLGQRTPSHSLGGSAAYGSLGGGGGGGGGGTSPLIASSMNASLSRQHPGSKAYWESVQAAQQQQQQQQQNALYGSAGNTPSHKSSPQSAAAAHWSHSPNVLSSPSSSTPSPIPCPSTPHHFNTSSSPHHQQQHSQQPLVDATGSVGGGSVHKVYNGIGGLGSGSNSSSSNSSGGSSNPLQSLQKMVQIDAESGSDLRAQYETAGPPLPMGAIGGGGSHGSGNVGNGNAGGNAQGHPMEGDPNFPTYYNLDQNRMCATPVSGVPGGGGYSNTGPLPPPPPSHGLQTPFSPTMKNGAALPPLPQPEAHHRSSGGGGLHSSKSVESDSGSADLAMNNNSSRSASVRFSSSKLAKEGSANSTNSTSFLSNRSCSTDTVCSANSGGGSPSTAGSVKAASMVSGEPPAILGEQTHDSVNSFRGSEATANSRDSVKSSDSECGVLSAFVSASQCSTPNGQSNTAAGGGGGGGGGSSNWKLNSTQSNDSFRSTSNNFSSAANNGQSVQSSKAWWPENAAVASAISPSPSSRSFTPHLSDCSAGGGPYGGSSYSSGHTPLPQSSSTSQNGPPLGSSGGAHWSQSSSTPSASASSVAAQMMSGNNSAGFTPDGPVIVKKKRGRPFGSKNRRNIDQQAATAASSSSAGPATETVSKRKRKSALVDAAVNTTLSFDVPSSLHLDDYTAFESYSSSSLKHSVPLAMKRKKLVGPVVRIEQQQSSSQSGQQTGSSQPKYSVLNNSPTSEEMAAAKAASIAAAAAAAAACKSSATFGKPVGVDSICLPPPTSTGRKNSALARRCTANSNGGITNGSVSSSANHSSSISSPSSASTPDRNWVCVLCHKGPHYRGLGDLYGPYTVLIERNKLPSSLLESIATTNSSNSSNTSNIDSTNGSSDQQQNEESAVEQQQQQQQSSSQSAAVVEQSTIERRSLRRRVDSNAAATDPAEGKGKTTHSSALSHSSADDSKDPSSRVSLEVWIHEDCIVWSNNVYLDGTVIRNLEQAIVDSFGSICTKCKLPGATLDCIYKSCTVSPLHYLCAKDKDCDLDEEKFVLSCLKHKKRRIPSTTTTTSKEFEMVEVSEATTTATISEGCC